MARFNKAALLASILGSQVIGISSFVPTGSRSAFTFQPKSNTLSKSILQMSSSTEHNQKNDFNAVKVAKTGGRGAISAAQDAVDKNLSLGAPRERPKGGHYLTKGGVQITANVDSLAFVQKNMNGDASPEGSSVRAIEDLDLVDQLDYSKGVLLSSSYEFPGRYVSFNDHCSLLITDYSCWLLVVGC